MCMLSFHPGENIFGGTENKIVSLHTYSLTDGDFERYHNEACLHVTVEGK